MACLEEKVDASGFIPLLRPRPIRLSTLADRLDEIHASDIFSNFGPVNTRFEQALVADMFGGEGASLTVCNATIGLMIALQRARQRATPGRRYALMPAFTFAATAQAALWAGLTPLLCDIDPHTWLACERSEAELCRDYGDRIAVIVPCTTLGNPVDMTYYRRLADRIGCGIVVDAAACLGTRDRDGQQFGLHSPDPVVFSLHATKAFASGEGGVLYASGRETIDELRRMANFGFDAERRVVDAGLNAKLSEVAALQALAKLEEFETVVAHRFERYQDYVAELPDVQFQEFLGTRWAPMFVSVLLPPELAPLRDAVRARMKDLGVGTGVYFDPHLGCHPYLGPLCVQGPLPNTEDICRRVLALPMSDVLTRGEVGRVAKALRDACAWVEGGAIPARATDIPARGIRAAAERRAPAPMLEPCATDDRR